MNRIFASVLGYIGVLVGLSFGALRSSFACSISINEVRVKNDLTAEALSSLNITIDKVQNASVSGYSHQILSTDPATFCPAQMRYLATVTVKYRPNIRTLCNASLQVIKTEWWVHPPAGQQIENYTVDGLPSVSCSPSFIGPIVRP